MTWSQVCRRRLERHWLTRPAPDAATVAGAVCGVHAQVMSAAEVAIGLRTAGVTRAGVRAALWQRRDLVKTYGPRGTVHLYPAAELASWCAALAAAPWPPSGLPAAARLSAPQTAEVLDALAVALATDDLTAAELDREVARRAGPWAVDPVLPAFGGTWPRWRQALATAAYRGVLCFGPHHGRYTTYTSPARWLPGFAPAGPGTAAAGADPTAFAVLRYLAGYGPATAAQFGQWLGVPARAARELFARLSPQLTEVRVGTGGEVAYLPAGDGPAGDGPAGGPGARATGATSVLLLPYFDPYPVGCHPRPAVFPGPAADRALPGGQAGPVPVLLVAGVVAGVWQQRRTGARIAVTVEPFVPLSAAARRRLDVQAQRVATIAEGRLAGLTLGTVTARGHL